MSISQIKKIDGILNIVRQIELNCIQSSSQIRKHMETTLNYLSNRCQNLNKQMDKNICLIDQVIKSFKITAEIKNIKLTFNGITKATCLVLSEDKKTAARGQGSGGYPIVLVNQPFTQANNEFKFRITKEPEKKAMWLGVCVKDIVQNHNYLSCYGTNKGTWAIDQVGLHHVSAYSWSHHDSNYNSAPKVGWQFHLGDTISLKVDFAKSTVRFTRNNDSYQQPILLNLGEIYAFVGPTNVGDTYEIV